VAVKALYADDDPVVRRLIGAVLGRLEHEAIEARDGEEAWQVFRAVHPSLVVLDIEMPHRSGLEVCRLIREQEPQRETFVLVLTGRDTEEDLLAILDAGADDYMPKPATPENLYARLTIADRRVRLDRERRRVEQELQRARWLAGIGETTITLQHEINNPLAALLANAELLMMDARAAGEENEQVETIYEQARRIATVIRRLGQLQDPKSVDYIAGSKMIDLSERE
jgi:DNA-binding response OmpR family regulator